MTFIENAVIGMYRTTPSGEILEANSALCRMLGYPSVEDLKRLNLERGEYPPRYLRSEFKKRLETTNVITGLESPWETRDGRVIIVRENARAIRDGNGEVMYFDGTAEDVTERAMADEELREAALKFQMVFDNANDGISIFEEMPDLEQRRLVDCNARYAEMAGRSREELLRVGVTRDISKQLTSPDWPAIRKGVPWHGTFSWIRPDGKENIVEYTAITAIMRGKKYTIGIDRDVTERMRVEGVIRASLHEKEILLREVHHRVKNNLQVVSSLLSLQARSIEDEKSKGFFRESMERIRVMALVHERLYKSESLAAIDFGEYLESVTADLVRATSLEGVICSVEADEVRLGINTAVPCGLIVNELLSNAFTHAFPGRKDGFIRVRLRRVSEGKLALSVEDDGIGFPEGKTLHDLTSMGMTVVTSLVDQISGTIELQKVAGTKFVIEFPG